MFTQFSYFFFEYEDEEEDDIGSDFSDENDDHLGELRERSFNGEENKSRFTEYSMSSSVIRRNAQLTLLDDRFEKVIYLVYFMQSNIDIQHFLILVLSKL